MNNTSVVYVVDDDPGMRKSLALVMESAALPCKLFESADHFLSVYRMDDPGVLLLDLQMPGMHGMELVRLLRQRGLHLPIVVVTGTATVHVAVEAMKLGTVDFLEKPVDHQILLSRIEQAIAKDAAKRVEASEARAIRQRLATLTDREREVLELIIKGHANKQIALDLGISIKTVAIHRSNLMTKTAAVNTADLVRMSMVAATTSAARPSVSS
jgi:two-component system response regulator FixJ